MFKILLNSGQISDCLHFLKSSLVLECESSSEKLVWQEQTYLPRQ